MYRLHCLSRWILALMIALLASGMSLGYAAAAPAGGAPRADKKLAQMYRLEQQRLRVQGQRLTKAAAFAAKFDQLIAKFKAKGQDTAALEQTVAAYRSAIERARGEWTAAQSALGTHAGFDSDGKVTNADQARATLQDAHSHMKQAHTIAKGALKDLRRAFAAFRKAHRGVPAIPAPEEP